jgi:site-specific recombinase XerD
MSLIYKDIFSTPGLERPSLASLARSLAISPSNLTLNRECPMTKGAPKAETRSLHRPKLSIEHFAFMRGWCQGLDPRDLWMRYLARFGEFDARRCRSFIKDLQLELGAIARRSGRPELAQLLKRHANWVVVPDSDNDATPRQVLASEQQAAAHTEAVPSLEEFRLQFDEDMYSEAELIELWKEVQVERASQKSVHSADTHTPPPALTSPPPPSPVGRNRDDRALHRRSRLVARQLDMLDWLEHLACESPQPSDQVRSWLDSVTCDRLEAVGILTLSELTFYIRTKGYRWYAKIPKVGEKGAGLIVNWLTKQSATLGNLPAHSLVPRSRLNPADISGAASAPFLSQDLSNAPAIAPLERLALPSSLSTAEPGAPGSNRAPAARCKLLACNDFEAIQEWLALWPAGSHTWRAYRREAERFLLWAVFGRGKALSALSSLDCVSYREFLSAPTREWCGPRNSVRWSAQWRPFEGPLSARSAETALTILSSMCEWLTRRRYLDSNPWDGVPKATRTPSMPTSRALSRHHWSHVETWLYALPSDPASNRLRLLMGFAYRSGLREAELAAAKVEWLRHEQLDDGVWGWSMMVLGKRNKWREVMLPDSAIDIIRESFVQDGLGADLLACPPDTPIIAALPSSTTKGPGRQPLTPGRIYEIVKEGFSRCADEIASVAPSASARLRKASTHWLRHTYGTHAVETMPIQILQMQMGHESPTTTAIYAKAEKSRRQQAVRAAFDPTGKD